MKREKKVRFPTREELECLTDDAVPLAKNKRKSIVFHLNHGQLLMQYAKSARNLHSATNIKLKIL